MPSPFEILRNRIDPDKLRGNEVLGIILISDQDEAEASQTETFQAQLIRILTSNYPAGFLTTIQAQEFWRKVRAKQIEKHGGESLYALFPENKAHRGISGFVNILARSNIHTVSDLFELEKDVKKIDGIMRLGPIRQQAIELILDHFRAERQKEE